MLATAASLFLQGVGNGGGGVFIARPSSQEGMADVLYGKLIKLA